MDTGCGRDLRPSMVEGRLRAGLRAEAERCAAAEPARLVAACAAIPRTPAPGVGRRPLWIAAAAAAAVCLITWRVAPLRPDPAPPAVIVRVATAADLARLYAARPHMPAVVRPPPPVRLVAVRPPPPVGSARP